MRHRSWYYSLFGLTVSLIGSAAILRAQSVGQIVETVVDPTGALIPQAKITALQEGTGLTRSAVYSTSGNYSLPDLPVGTYDVSAEASGFQKANSIGITL